jgi:hypothetical protein
MSNKIDYVIMGSTKDAMYLDFWPLVSKVWKTKYGVTPVLGLISDKDTELIETEHGLIKEFKSVDLVDQGLQSQIVRLFLPKILSGFCMLSDIDMFPTSKQYFEDKYRLITEDNVVIYSSNHPQTINEKMFPICYVSAHSSIFNKIFNLQLSWEDFCVSLHSRNWGWYTDQKYLFENIINFGNANGDVILLDREWKSNISNRIDRGQWGYDITLLKKGYYIDCHSLRPYQKYKNEIDALINLL